MAGMIRRALAGAGGAIETAGLDILRSDLAEQRATRLAELQNQYQSARDERRMGHETGMLNTRLAHDAAEGAANRGNSRDIAELSRTTQTNIAKMQDSTQRFIAEMRNTQDERQHGERMAALNRQLSLAQQQLAMSGIKIVNDRDGMAMSYTSFKDGKPTVEYVPIMHEGKRVKAGQAENIPAIASALASVANANAKFLESPTALGNPETARAFTQQMQALNQAATTLMAGITGASGTGGAGNGSGVDWGQIIGGQGGAGAPPPGRSRGMIDSTAADAGSSDQFTPQEQARIDAAKSPAERVQVRNAILRERLKRGRSSRATSQQETDDEAAGMYYNNRGIDPNRAYFGQ